MRLIGLAVILTVSLSAAPLAGEGQPATKVPRVRFISAGTLAPRTHLWSAFREGPRGLGYVGGQNIVFEYRASEREGDPYDGLAAELVRLKVDVIVAVTDAAAQAAQRATGLVASLARPGGNVTGLSNNSEATVARLPVATRESVPEAQPAPT